MQMHPQTAMASALAAAGYAPGADRLMSALLKACAMTQAQWNEAPRLTAEQSTPKTRERLKSMASQAMKSQGMKWDASKDAFFKLIRNDADLLWELFQPYRALAVQKIMTEAAGELMELEREKSVRLVPSAPGHCPSDSQQKNARRTNETSPSVGAGRVFVGNHRNDADSTRSTSGMAAIAAVTKLSLLDTMKINGQALGDLTSADALAWSDSHGVKVRFVRAVAANLPPHLPIRKFRTGDDVQTIWDRVSGEASDVQ